MIMTYSDVCDERKYKVDYIHMKTIIPLKRTFPGKNYKIKPIQYHLKIIKMDQLPVVKFMTVGIKLFWPSKIKLNSTSY